MFACSFRSNNVYDCFTCSSIAVNLCLIWKKRDVHTLLLLKKNAKVLILFSCLLIGWNIFNLSVRILFIFRAIESWQVWFFNNKVLSLEFLNEKLFDIILIFENAKDHNHDFWIVRILMHSLSAITIFHHQSIYTPTKCDSFFNFKK